MIDGSEGDADERFATIDRELSLYGAGLDTRPQIVVLNKADLSPDPAPFAVEDGRILAVHRRVVRDGRRDRRAEGRALRAVSVRARAEEAETELPEFLDYRPTPPHRRAFRIFRTDRGFRIVGDAPDGDELEEALRSAGVAPRSACRDRRRGAGMAAMSVGVFGGAFDPPHVGHVALARAGIDHFALDRLLVRVVESPGTRTWRPRPRSASLLAELAFASLDEAEVALDPFARTVDSLEALALVDPVFLIGADEFVALPTWKDPERVLELARLGVAMRPGIDDAALEAVLAGSRGRNASRSSSSSRSPSRRRRFGRWRLGESRSTVSSRPP